MKSLVQIGAFLVIIGSFLPWEQGGDFLPYCAYGIRVYPFVDDNGGTIVLLLALLSWVLIFQPPKLIENPLLWALATSALLAASSLFFVIKWLVHRLETGPTIGSPVIQIGLISVVIGTGFLLFSAIKNYRQAKVD